MIATDEKVEILKKVEIFAKSSDDALRGIAQGLLEIQLPPDRSIIRKGEMGNCMYILYEGKVKVHDGEHTIVELGRESIFGEFSLLDAEPRSASVSTIQDSVVFRLDQDVFFDVINEYPEVMRNIIHLIVKRLRDLNNNVVAGLKKREQELTEIVDERTKDLQVKNQELNNAFDEIKAQNDHLEEAYREIEFKNAEITASIRYARRIQFAILPRISAVKEALPHSFILYKPKDIVSGDFYWFTQIGELALWSAVDCTGHGVPGAFMSVLGNSLLNQIVKENGITQPNLILDELHVKIIETLRQVDKSSETNDGMDLGLCTFNSITNMLYYSGAQRPMLRFRNGELEIFKGDKFSIGGSSFMEQRTPYSLHSIKVEPGDVYYVFSDGYADQFGGPRGRKMQNSRMANFISEIVDLPPDEQRYRMDKFFEDWRGNEEQLDDILVIGVKFPEE